MINTDNDNDNKFPNFININNKINNNNQISKGTPTISFATHNVQSLHCDIKNELIHDTFFDFDTDFVGLTETRHKSDQFYKNRNNPNFISFWSTHINTYAGVGILIKRSWAIFVQRTFLDNDRFIYIDLFLAGNIKLRVFSIYLQASVDSASKKDRLKLHKTILGHIKEGIQSDFKIVLLGDFNADLDSYWSYIDEGRNLPWRFDFYSKIFAMDFLDLYGVCHDTPQPTFLSKNSRTRIDSIFASPNLISDFLYSYVDSTDMYSSDHRIVFASFANIIGHSQAKSRSMTNKRRIPNLRSMNPTKWSKFAEYTNFHYNCHNLDRLKDFHPNLSNMNSLWNGVKSSILTASQQEILHIWILPIQKEKLNYDSPNSSIAAKKVGSILLMFKNRLIQQKLWPKDLAWSQTVAKLRKIIDKMKLTPFTFPCILNENNVLDVKKFIKTTHTSLLALAKVDLQKIKEITIQQLIDKRCDDLLNDTSKMIDSILNRKKRSIVMDRLLIDDQLSGSKRFTIDPDEIKSAAIDHFQNYALPTSPSRPLTCKWIQQYKPKDYINKDWFSNLLQPPTFDEWVSTVNGLPNDKAAGPSGISNEMLKHLGDKTQHLLWQLICMCFNLGQIPNEWKIAHIYPIPKPMDWNCDITKTRPITLLETARKGFVKILNNRLSKLLAKHHILKGGNFAGLPGGSTEPPIKILNMLLEDANENNKDIWILLQDLSKAYDRVDLSYLRKALDRIKIPPLAGDLIINLFTARKNAIFTSTGISDYYDVKIGIDQGEVISPLLWCIYLDPLLCEVNNLKKGYIIEHKWPNDLTNMSIQHLSAQISSLAFMDDTNWIASSKKDLEAILSTAEEFYNFTRSALNKDKSKLLTTKRLESPSLKLKFGSTSINITPEIGSVRFLGVWINSKRSPRFVKNQIVQDIRRFVNLMRFKPLTDKQVSYIVNMVLCPLIEYRMKLTPLSKKECDSFFAPIRVLLKRKCKFAITLPTTLLNFKEFYNLNDLWSLQIKSISSALLFQFNNSTLYELISKIRLFQLQTNFVMNVSPLSFWNRPYNSTSYKNLIGASLSLILSTSSKISFSPSSQLINFIKGGSHPLCQILPFSILTKQVHVLTKHNIFYLDQLITKDGNHLIRKSDLFLRDFNHANLKLGNSNLFETIEPLILADFSSRLLQLEYRLDSPLPQYRILFDFSSPTFSRNEKKSVAYWDFNSLLLVYGLHHAKQLHPPWLIC